MRKPLLLLLAITLLLSACSRVGLAYRNLDWLIPWKLGDYVALTSEQSAWLKPQLQEHLAWHCSVELPRYLDWLQRSQQALSSRDSELMASQLADFEQAMQRIAVEITPSAIELLRGLSPRQVDQLLAAMDEQNAKLREEFLEPPVQEQVSRRAERMEERLQTEIDVPEGLLSAEFPTMMVQTLVENAIKHGLEPRTGGGTVWIRARRDGDAVAVTVADNGEGFNTKTSGTGIGLKNVRERLRLRYAGDANLSVIANFPAGVAATITVPTSLRSTAHV